MIRGVLCFALATSLIAQVTHERILNAEKDPTNWLTYSGNYQGLAL